ncbi:hypothetical protein Sta7437_1323 [Stanieria cyanosphaera PCC 7437]|uniref:Phytase-like domain-containing protein n=1 Tax=Stanieria cyanosphaera (strain ATCC 29371 / PCC 7437) TaxID=111780 RepID=K9XQJ5_STAC7|nr:esterase-like activity of phytase family protein [Stanieria cyanosphaera]AFZ34890.1 hypothetical protein Sta7437_1323 [Stanieria cyanosphaera PCC 7437]
MSDRKFYRPVIKLATSFILLILVTACSTIPRVSAQERMFLPLALEFLGEYQLPKQKFQDTQVGGLSAVTYDRQHNRLYALSDDRSNLAPARFYTLSLKLQSNNLEATKINKIEIEKVTFLSDEQGNPYPAGSIDPEGMALSPRGTVFIASEGNLNREINPFIGEFDLNTGKKILDLRLPQRFLSDPTGEEAKGIQDNLAFEPLTVNQTGLASQDPFRLFTATESALKQDSLSDPEQQARIRLLHYVINPIGNPVIVAEHLYLLDPASVETISNGLTELLALDKEGYLLSLERTFGFTGAGAKIFQVVNGNATDTSSIAAFQGEITSVKPLSKKLVFDLSQLGIYLDNLEGMTFGPRLPDGSQTLLLVSDDNFNPEQVTQFLLFRLSINH